VPFVKEIERAMAARGVTVVDCPISGGPPGARAGTLSVMVSGDQAEVERVRLMNGAMLIWNGARTVATEFATGRDSTGRDEPGGGTFRDAGNLENPSLSGTIRDAAGQPQPNYKTAALPLC
jgi:hypothetical protein